VDVTITTGTVMLAPLENRVALVTGAATGIGRACCVALAEAGARVIVSDLASSEDGGRETVSLVEAAGAEARWIACDVSREADVRQLVDETIRAFGRLDVAVNNAGIDGKQAPLADHPEDNYARVLDVNLHGTWLCMKYQLPHMTATRPTARAAAPSSTCRASRG
jgi:NAD(P)-dependent dehydrogenase (short-subunit alcohol dehydrogenase family)